MLACNCFDLLLKCSTSSGKENIYSTIVLNMVIDEITREDLVKLKGTSFDAKYSNRITEQLETL